MEESNHRQTVDDGSGNLVATIDLGKARKYEECGQRHNAEHHTNTVRNAVGNLLAQRILLDFFGKTCHELL